MRSHIAKFFTIALIWCGLGLYMVQPAQAKSSARSFANWFNSVAKKTADAELSKELDELKESGASLSGLIEYASRIISENNEDFNLPLEDASASHQIYQVLLSQWSQYQTGNGLAKVPPPEGLKSGNSLQLDTCWTTETGEEPGVVSAGDGNIESGKDTGYILRDRSLVPMVTGIAIGAP